MSNVSNQWFIHHEDSTGGAMITREDHFPYTFNDYLLLPEGAPVQLIGGELVREPSPTPLHQRVSGALFLELSKYILERGLGMVYAAPLDVYFDKFDAFQPDIIFISSERSGIIGNKFIEGAPDLVIEILSPSSVTNDLTRKKAVYERSGVREYWIVDPRKGTIDCLTNVDGEFRDDGRVDGDGVLRSTTIAGFEVEARTIFGRF